MTAATFAMIRLPLEEEAIRARWPPRRSEMNTNEKPRMKKIDATTTRRRACARSMVLAPVPSISSRVSPEMYER